MREPYGEGPASHTGPESCVRDGNVGSESVRTRRRRMRQFLTYGSVRGAARKGGPYRDSTLFK